MALTGISPHNRSPLSYKISLDAHEPKDEPFMDRVERWVETNQCSATLAAVFLLSVSRCVRVFRFSLSSKRNVNEFEAPIVRFREALGVVPRCVFCETCRKCVS